MRPELQDILLREIVSEWKALSPQHRPWGMWITLHTPLAEGTDSIRTAATPALTAWFLNREGLRRRNIWEYARFYVMHAEQPWCGNTIGVPNGVWGNPHLIGLASFAEYVDTEDIYLETVWGGLWGRGDRVTIDAYGQIQWRQSLWVS